MPALRCPARHAGGAAQDHHRLPDAHHAGAAVCGGACGAGHRKVHPRWGRAEHSAAALRWWWCAPPLAPPRVSPAAADRSLRCCCLVALRCVAAASSTLEGVVILRENPDYVSLRAAHAQHERLPASCLPQHARRPHMSGVTSLPSCPLCCRRWRCTSSWAAQAHWEESNWLPCALYHCLPLPQRSVTLRPGRHRHWFVSQRFAGWLSSSADNGKLVEKMPRNQIGMSAPAPTMLSWKDISHLHTRGQPARESLSMTKRRRNAQKHWHSLAGPLPCTKPSPTHSNESCRCIPSQRSAAG